MKAILTSLLVLFGSISMLYAQTQSPSSRIKEKYFFIYLDGDKVHYFLNKPESNEPITNAVFPLTGTYSNIYMKWLNPLKYSIEWKDTVSVDPRDQAIKDYIAAMQVQHGAAATTVTKGGSESKDGAKFVPTNNVEIKIPIFRNQGLSQLYTAIRASQPYIVEEDRIKINNFAGVLKELDAENSKIDMTLRLDKIFATLYAIQQAGDVEKETKLIKNELEKNEASYKDNEHLQFLVKRDLGKLELKNKVEQERIETTVDEFLLEAAKKLATNKSLQTKVPPVLEIMNNSIKNPSKEQPEYFPVKSVSFEEGKVLKTTLTITGKEYESNTRSFKSSKELAKTNLKFERYDPFGISLSTGIFYGSTTLKGFGVSNENNEFTVTEDNIEEGNFVTAAFLNFTFNAGSRYLLPFFQLGIDPTKKRPFLMAGGGFRIPSSKFALSGGPLWTWNHKLNKLSVGQKISSTSELEKDIKYEFDPSPKGWYLGFQYNF